MTLLIRFPQGRLVDQHRGKCRELAIASASLLTPVCVMAYVLAFWRLAADVGMARDGGTEGVFSHWQLWLAIAAGLQVTARNLYRKLEQGDWIPSPSAARPGPETHRQLPRRP
ncbi:MAG: hypothetical protein ABIR70_24670 [Bryobacteraceae bacterium]